MTLQLTLNSADRATQLRSIATLGLGKSIEATFENGTDENTISENPVAQNRLNNFLSSISAYADMSPDLAIRREVNNWLLRRDRQALDLSDWCESFGYSRNHQHDHTHQQVLAFVYESFGEYSGLDFSRVRPNDSLNGNLHFPLICWFDWTITFCEEFFQAFDVDLSDRFDEADFVTIGELTNFLVEQVVMLGDRVLGDHVSA